jgi:choline dehydrogenase-like flavoprotein
LQLQGLDGLLVVDASVMPGPTPNAPSIMIAEKGVAMVKDAAAKTDGAAFGGSVAWPLLGYR